MFHPWPPMLQSCFLFHLFLITLPSLVSTLLLQRFLCVCELFCVNSLTLINYGQPVAGWWQGKEFEALFSDILFFFNWRLFFYPCSPGWPVTQDSPASASWVLGLQVCHHAQLCGIQFKSLPKSLDSCCCILVQIHKPSDTKREPYCKL
jgi:hypothetical protein